MRRICSVLFMVLVASTVLAAPLTMTVSCSGTGTRPPQLSVTPSALSFGDVDSGMVVIKAFTVRNAGSGVLVGTVRPRVTCGPDYALLVNGEAVPSISYSLPAGQTQTVSVRFAPIRVGPQSCDYDVGQ